ncbi:hypothetical protein LL969_06095 [Xanthomonas campestris pv. phormiicola]|nr:hypothetical protein [Xanthomonas campestris pv. phormiicola]
MTGMSCGTGRAAAASFAARGGRVFGSARRVSARNRDRMYVHIVERRRRPSMPSNSPSQ